MKKAVLLLMLFTTVVIVFAQPGDSSSNAVAANTAAFNADSATQHYLDTLAGKARQKSDSYFEGGYWLILWSTLYAILVGGIFMLTGLSKRLKAIATKVNNVNLQNFIFAALYFLVAFVLMFPFSVYEGYFREHSYGLSNLSFGGWFKEELIGLGLISVFGSMIVAFLYVAMRKTGKNWWIWGAAGGVFFSAFVAFIAPVFISPLFNDYKPLADGPLKQEILSMARANEIPAENVYQFDASKQSDRVSANVSGFGSTTRISLNDNLLKRCTPAEIKSVMGHEMGHYVMNHVYKGIMEISILLFIGFWLVNLAFNAIVSRYGERLHITGIGDIAGFPLVVVLFTVLSFLLTPLSNSLTRTQEAEADMFGLNVAREPDAEAHVDMMLAEYRKIDPGYWEEIIFFDHPGGRNRIHMAMQWKAEHLKDCK